MRKPNYILIMSFHSFNLIAPFEESIDSFAKIQSNPIRLIVVLIEGEDKVLLDGLFTNILAAIKIDLKKEVCLIKVKSSNQKFNIYKALKDLKVDKVICFGLAPNSLMLNFDSSFYQPVVQSGNTFLFVDSLASIENNKDYKKLLWNNLQSIFLAK